MQAVSLHWGFDVDSRSGHSTWHGEARLPVEDDAEVDPEDCAVLGDVRVSIAAVGRFRYPFEADVQPEIILKRLVMECAGRKLPLVVVKVLLEGCVCFVFILSAIIT